MNQEQLRLAATKLKRAIHSLQEDTSAGKFKKRDVIELKLATESVLQSALDLNAVEFSVDGYLIRTGPFTSQEAVEAYLAPKSKPAISRPIGKAPVIIGCKLKHPERAGQDDYWFFTGTLQACQIAAQKLSTFGIETVATGNGNNGKGYLLVPLFVTGTI